MRKVYLSFLVVITTVFVLLGLSPLPAVPSDAVSGIEVSEPRQYNETELEDMLLFAKEQLMNIRSAVNLGQPGTVGTIQGKTHENTVNITSISYYPTLKATGSKQTATNKCFDDAAAVTETKTEESATTEETTMPKEVAIPTPTASPMMTNTSALSLSAGDIMREKIALTYLAENYRYMMTKSLGDRPGRKMVLLGFDISVLPEKRHENCVAQVLFTIRRDDGTKSPTPTPTVTASATPAPTPTATASATPAPGEISGNEEEEEGNDKSKTPGKDKIKLVHIFPLKETYNIESIVEKTNNIGLGVVVGPVPVGVGSSSRKASAYLVRDIDTIALVRETDKEIICGWQFRPVLGKKIVEPGIRRVYVMLSVPNKKKQVDFTSVSREWLHVDPKTGAMKEKCCNYSEEYRSAPVFSSLLHGPQLKSKTGILLTIPEDLAKDTLIRFAGDDFSKDMKLTVVYDGKFVDIPRSKCKICYDNDESRFKCTALVPSEWLRNTRNMLYVENDAGTDSLSIAALLKETESASTIPSGKSLLGVTLSKSGASLVVSVRENEEASIISCRKRYDEKPANTDMTRLHDKAVTLKLSLEEVARGDLFLVRKKSNSTEKLEIPADIRAEALKLLEAPPDPPKKSLLGITLSKRDATLVLSLKKDEEAELISGNRRYLIDKMSPRQNENVVLLQISLEEVAKGEIFFVRKAGKSAEQLEITAETRAEASRLIDSQPDISKKSLLGVTLSKSEASLVVAVGRREDKAAEIISCKRSYPVDESVKRLHDNAIRLNVSLEEVAYGDLFLIRRNNNSTERLEIPPEIRKEALRLLEPPAGEKKPTGAAPCIRIHCAGLKSQ